MTGCPDEGRYRAYFDESPVAVFVADERGRYVDVNPAACELVGYERAELLSMAIPDLAAGDTEPGRVESFEALRERGAVRTEDTLIHAEGHEVDVLMDAVAVEGDRFVAYCQDITGRKRYEKQVKEQRDGLKMLNQLLRHDVRNDLQVINGYVELARELCEGSSRAYLDTARQHTEHAIDLTNVGRELAEVVLAVEDRLGAVALEPVVDREIEDLRAAHPDATVLRESVPTASVVADDLLGSVLRNLLQNAIQHNDGDEPEVRVVGEDRDDTVVIRVADDGPGIPDDRKEAIFRKGEHGTGSRGTGLGLYLVETLVETYGGDVWVEDREARPASGGSARDGAVFAVELQKA
ncbi:ATP-binding protein [Halobellus rufus]|uniref:ATP-binding protein n=1 Tax=Halobellus rufus TaxID=1448860 RepID=UPI000678EBD7|nr:PAS domain-containing sensor histidine kinase [Halobellus rufus]